MSPLRAALALALIGSVATVLGGSTSAQAAVPTQPFDRYVALGDSFTAGPLIPPTNLAPCARTTNNYPRILADRLGLKLTDVSCSSARTEHMAGPQKGILGVMAPPQFDALQPDTDLVTLGIGGNDSALFGTLIEECPALAKTNPDGSPCRDKFTQDGVDLMSAKVVKTKSDVLGVLDGIRERSPYAQIAVVGYLRLMPESGSCSNGAVPMTSKDMLWADEIQGTLNTALSPRLPRSAARSTSTCTARPAATTPAPARTPGCRASGSTSSRRWSTTPSPPAWRRAPRSSTRPSSAPTWPAASRCRPRAPSTATPRRTPSTTTPRPAGRAASGPTTRGCRSTSAPVVRWTGWCSLGEGVRLGVPDRRPDDGASWRTVWDTINGDGAHDTASFAATQARYVRVTAGQRATRYGIPLRPGGLRPPAGGIRVGPRERRGVGQWVRQWLGQRLRQ